MGAAESARKRADGHVKELLNDAVALKRELERLIRNIAEEGTCLGTKSVAQQAADLDRKAQYLEGLTEGLAYGEPER